MDPSRVLLLLYVSIALPLLFQLARRRDRPLGWIVVFATLALSSGAGWLLVPESAGLWLLIPFVIFIALPVGGNLLVERLVAQRRLRAARMLARLAWIGHPADAIARLPLQTRIHELAAQGKLEEAQALVPTLPNDPATEQLIALELLRQRGDWEGLALKFAAIGTTDSASAPIFLRTLGEVGDLDGLARAYERCEPLFSRPASRTLRPLAQLFLFSFFGQRNDTERILHSSLASLDPATKRFWLATADAARGAEMAVQWRELSQDGDARLRTAAARRLNVPLARAAEYVKNHTELFARVTHELDDEARFGRSAAQHQRPVMSYFFLGVCALVHGVVYLFSRADPSPLTTLDRFGAFWPPAIFEDGQWWRLATACFLHVDALHLSMNSLALWVFGPFVERFWGRFKFTIFFLATGVGSFATLLFVIWRGWKEPEFAVGASGAIMGLVGGSTAIFLRGAREVRSQVASRRLRTMLAAIAMQVVFDFAVPQVSFTAHAGGLTIGFLLGLILTRVRPATKHRS